MHNIIVWDIETVPDLRAYAAANGMCDATDEAVREAIGDKVPKHIFHCIACIGVLVAKKARDAWVVEEMDAPHIGEHTEAELISWFAAKINRLDGFSSKLVTFNGSSFDMPVLRYRAMANRVAVPGLAKRAYFHRYSEDAIDLCDVLSSFGSTPKAKLDELCKVVGLPGKPADIDGSKVAQYVLAGRIREVADYCKGDVINTYRLWLRYELFRGHLSAYEFDKSENALAAFCVDTVMAA